MQLISRFRSALVLLILFFPQLFSISSADSFSVKRIGNLIPFNDNAFTVNAPESGELVIQVHDDISVYRILRQEIGTGESTIHWDGCAFNHEKLAAKNYTITAVLNASSGKEYTVSFNTPVEYTGQCLQYLLPSSEVMTLNQPDDWFVEFRTVQKGVVVFCFTDIENKNNSMIFSINTTGGRINRLTYNQLNGKEQIRAGVYHVTVYEKSRKEETFEFDLSVLENELKTNEVFLTGEILPEEDMSENEIWQLMQKPSVVVDIDPFKHQKVYKEKDEGSFSFGTLHGQTQALKVMLIENDWAFIGAWNHEEAEYIEGWVPVSILKVVEPNPDYGILINKKNQTMDIYYRGNCIETLEISTGRPGVKYPEQETAAGSFLTGYHRVDFSTNGKKYDYVIQYDGGNLLHQIPYEWGKDKKDFTYGRGCLGAKASHACIRIQAEPGINGINAYWIWTHIPYHTRIIILDDPVERRPVTESPTIINDPFELDDYQLRIVFEDEKKDEKKFPETITEEINGHLIGYARCSEKEYLRNPGVVAERIRKLLETGCEKTVLKCYWEDQKEEKHTAIQEAMARKGIKAGADLVIGNGNKTFLGCEGFEDGMILYGLGDGKTSKSRKQGALTTLTAEIIFDFGKENSRPIVILKPVSSGANAEQIISRFTDDSIGSGIRQVYLYLENNQS